MVTLTEEMPYAAVVGDDFLNAVCSYCFANKKKDVSINLARCIGCRVLHYCSNECQKKDWANHKYECRLLKKCSPSVPPKMFRLIARVAFKLKRSDAYIAELNGRTYEDVMDHRENMLNHPEGMEEFASFSLILHEYMGARYVPNREVLMSIFGKVMNNSLRIGEEPAFIGTGLYIGLAAQNHSCDPDAFIVFDGSMAILRSTRVKEYSQDVTVSYINLLTARRVRQKELHSQYYVTCTCSVCSDPTEDFLRNSARSTCCPDSYCLLDPNASRLSCFKCGKPSLVTMDQAILANQRINIICHEMEKEHERQRKAKPSVKGSDEELQRMIQVHEKFSEVLSPLNVNLLRLTNRLFDLAFTMDARPVYPKHAKNIILAHKRYLSVGDPALAVRLMSVAFAMVFDTTPARWVLELLEEALATSITTYDPRSPHSMMEQLEMALTCYRMELQMQIFS